MRLVLACVTAVMASASLLSANGRGSHQQPDRRGGDDVRTNSNQTEPCVLWRDPIHPEQRNLFYGPGGEADAPRRTTFTFLEEDLAGTSAKFLVRDADGLKWKVKLGPEARPETAASRLVWAVGYSADEDYFLPEVQVKPMPARVHRGRKLIGPDGTMAGVRVRRDSDAPKKIGEWRWQANPFTGTRELNGLRVLMAVINNWDLKDINNAVLLDEGGTSGVRGRFCEVRDLGASFGAAGLERTERTFGDLDAYRRSKFITRVTDQTVDFEVPRRPAWIELVNVPQFVMRLHLRQIGRRIPRQDARWMGQLLARIPPDHIRDAFRAAGYSSDEVDGFAQVLESRIARLNTL